jgi:hypothetical protein
MGFFGRFVYSDGEWRDDAIADAYIAIEIHDSDLVTVDHRPTTAHGRFYLEIEPRDYFESPDESDPVVAEAEAASFGAWAPKVLGVEITAAQLRPLLAHEGHVALDDDFVEETVVRLSGLLRLPVPGELAGATDV